MTRLPIVTEECKIPISKKLLEHNATDATYRKFIASELQKHLESNPVLVETVSLFANGTKDPLAVATAVWMVLACLESQAEADELNEQFADTQE